MNKTLAVIFSRQPLFRAGVVMSLSDAHDIEIIQSREFSHEALRELDTTPPDVIIADIDDASHDPFNVIQAIKRHLPNIGIIVISRSDDDDRIFLALKSQAAAYATRDITKEELTKAVRRVAQGEYPINETFLNRPKVASKVVQQFQKLASDNDEIELLTPLTTREKEVLTYIARGYPNKQIADELNISEQTIKNHVTSSLRKLNANSRTHAVVQAIKQGLISAG